MKYLSAQLTASNKNIQWDGVWSSLFCPSVLVSIAPFMSLRCPSSVFHLFHVPSFTLIYITLRLILQELYVDFIRLQFCSCYSVLNHSFRSKCELETVSALKNILLLVNASIGNISRGSYWFKTSVSKFSFTIVCSKRKNVCSLSDILSLCKTRDIQSWPVCIMHITSKQRLSYDL